MLSNQTANQHRYEEIPMQSFSQKETPTYNPDDQILTDEPEANPKQLKDKLKITRQNKVPVILTPLLLQKILNLILNPDSYPIF